MNYKLANRQKLFNYLVISLVILCLDLFAILIRDALVLGYEPSFYRNIPLYTWIFIISAFVLTLYFIFIISSRDWSGIILLFLISLVLLIIPVIKYGKIYDRWDIWFHLAYTFDIIKTGGVDFSHNPYPALHIFASTLRNVLGTNILGIYKFIFPFLFSLKIIFTYILAKSLFSKRIAIMGATAAAVIPGVHMFGTSANPWSFSLLLIPLVIYTYFRVLETKIKNYIIILVVLLVTILIYHILSAIIMAGSLLLFELLRKVVNYYGSKEKYDQKFSSPVFSILITFIIGCIFVLIYHYKDVLFPMFNTVFRSGLQMISVGPNFSFFNAIKFFLPEIILGILFIIGIVSAFHETFYRKNNRFSLFVILLGFFITNVLLFIMSFFISLLPFEWNRPFNAAFIVAPVIIGVGLYKIFEVFKTKSANAKNKNILRKKLPTVLIILILTITFTVGLTTKYPSPYTFRLNCQNTDMEHLAVWWLGTYKNVSKMVFTGQSLSRYTAYLSASKNNWKGGYWGFENTIPTHLGYIENSGNHRAMKNGYLLLSQFVIIKGESGYVPNYQLSKEDLQKLHNDREVNRIYDNGGGYSYLISTSSTTHIN